MMLIDYGVYADLLPPVGADGNTPLGADSYSPDVFAFVITL